MNKQKIRNVLLVSICLLNSFNAMADPKIKRDRDEIMAIREAKRVTGGGLLISTDHDWTNWDVNILKGCILYEIEVSHRTGKVSSKHTKDYCDDVDALRKMHQQAHQYKMTHR